MDNVTHTLCSLAVARAGAAARLGPGSTACLLIAGNAPDLDIVTAAQGSLAYLAHHRGFTHGLAGAVVVAMLAGLLVRLCVRGSRLRPLFVAGLAGTSLHIFMDLWTSYGTRALLPFDKTWYAWDLVSIIDPWILATLALCLFVVGRGGRRRAGAVAALALVAGYVGVRAGLHQRALGVVRTQLGGQPVRRVSALPSSRNPMRWRIVADTGSAWQTGTLDLRTGTAALLVRPKAQSPAVAAAWAKSAVAGTFLDFSPYPLLSVSEQEDGTQLVWRDLRFEGSARRNSFVATVVVAPDGTIVRERFSF